jgi:hypothetical protein
MFQIRRRRGSIGNLGNGCGEIHSPTEREKLRCYLIEYGKVVPRGVLVFKGPAVNDVRLPKDLSGYDAREKLL